MTPERWHRITTIFHAALGKHAAERESYVAATCGNDPDVHAEVEAMLAAHRDAGAFGAPLALARESAFDPAVSGRRQLSTGTRLGYFEIISLLGEGGMGTVYRARDEHLRREVALKVLPSQVAGDGDGLARFRREARVLASLNHPNIAQVHGLEESDGVRAIVMELVDGESLTERIARGPLPLAETLPLVRQIAEALEAAHDQNVVHRDLKPANIMVRADGAVKVLDFGLAKEAGPTSASAEVTSPGLILGTVAYMPPEQAKGKAVDRRADMWAFGCVLFEMLTGRPTFGGETASDVLVRVIEHEPDWTMLPAHTPMAIRRLLRRCLDKDPRRRLDSAAVARLEIDEAARESTPIVPAPGARDGLVWRTLAGVAVGAGAIVLATMIPAGRAHPPDPPRPATSAFVARGLRLNQAGVHFAVAPDGRTVIFAGNYAGRNVLYRRDLDQAEPEPLAGTEGGSDAFFSPDGRALGFETHSELWTMPLGGGTPQRLAANQPMRGGTWGGDDRIVFARLGSGLWLARAAGGEPRQLTAPEQGERHELPQMLPGGRAVLFTILSSSKPPSVALYLFSSGEMRRLFEGVGARFVSSGHVVFGRQGKLWAVGFDRELLHTVGAARAVRDDVLWSTAGYPQFTVNADLLAYVRSSQVSERGGSVVLTSLNRQGGRHVLPLKPNNFMLPRWSPGGDRLVVQVGAGRALWMYDVARNTLAPLVSDRVVAYAAPAWTRDGRRVAFATWFGGDVGLGWLPSDGSGPVEVLVKDVGMRSFERTHPVLLPDEKAVIMAGLVPGESVEDLLVVPLVGERRMRPLFRAPGLERNPAIAPNARFIAYNSDESGRSEVYVRPLQNAGTRKWHVSPEGGSGPVWTRNGRELLYLDTRNRMMAVAVRQNRNGELGFSKPEPLFTIEATDRGGVDRSWDVTADGERFVFVANDVAASEVETSLELTLIHNWVDELKGLVPLQGK